MYKKQLYMCASTSPHQTYYLLIQAQQNAYVTPAGFCTIHGMCILRYGQWSQATYHPPDPEADLRVWVGVCQNGWACMGGASVQHVRAALAPSPSTTSQSRTVLVTSWAQASVAAT